MTSISGRSVLVVEDEFLIAIDAEAMLRKLGAVEVKIAGDFEVARKCLVEGSFDLVVLDVNLNGKMSFPLAEIAAARGIPILFATGYSMRDRLPANFGGSACVTKPYTQRSFAEGIAAALEPQRTLLSSAPSAG